MVKEKENTGWRMTRNREGLSERIPEDVGRG